MADAVVVIMLVTSLLLVLFAAAPPAAALTTSSSSNRNRVIIPNHPDLDDSKKHGVIHVAVHTPLPHVSPERAQQAWLEYQWKRGGDLLGVFVQTEEENEKSLPRRTLFPVGIQEELLRLEEEEESDDQCDSLLRYRVIDQGLLSNELVPDSHRGEVRFLQNADNKDSTEMVWQVDYQAQHRRDFWQAVTQLNIESASRNLASYLAQPVTYARTTHLRFNVNDVSKTKIDKFLADKWVDFVWNRGGGLPVPSVQLDSQRRVVVPPFLVERLVSIQDDDGTTAIEYTVDNPGLFTYQVHSHRGRVRFLVDETAANTGDGNVDATMIWEVEIRPLRGWAWLVQPFTAAIVSTICRNFKTHLREPGAKVKLAPPRGQGEAFGEIAKDSWLGGVLAAHLEDRRSTLEQTFAIFQPWTWGRSSATDEPGEGEEWTRSTA